MEALKSFLGALMCVILSVAISALNMIHGWGVEPKSWAVIIGLGFFGQCAIQACIEIFKHRD